VDKRFEQVDKRFEQVDRTLLGVRRDIAKLQSGQETILRQMQGMEAWVNFVTGNIRNDKGQSLEQVAAAGLSYGLNNPDIKPENIRLRQKLVDRDGLVYAVPYESEVDIIAQNGELIAFEVKSTGRPEEVPNFALKLKLLTLQNPDKKVRGVFIAPAAGSDLRTKCEAYGIELLEGPKSGQP
jgi:hypothetical protein